tara:strand:- start:1043 stop:1789 length:747 start_codon:yes stop_codon:yes gene_type:complete
MKAKEQITFLLILFLTSCAVNVKNKNKAERTYHTSTGFALIYEESLYKNKTINKKIDNQNIQIMHDNLRKGTLIRITNLENSKFIDTKIYKKAQYPKIFNAVISKKVASILNLDTDNPFIEIIELKKNKKFIAKEGNIFEEEKVVADKAPVDQVEMKNLSENNQEINTNKSKKNNFVIVISDFYYENSAISLKNEIVSKIKINNISIKKISDNKYRLLVGPYENFNTLKTTYISLNNLGFEGLNVFNE